MTSTLDTSGSTEILGRPYWRRHPRTVAAVRIAVAILLMVLAGIFCSKGYYWGAALLAPAALHLWLVYRLRTAVHGQR
jgi:hypothetical protein